MYQRPVPPSRSLTLYELLVAAGQRWIRLVLLTFGCGIAFGLLSYTAHREYEAKVIAMPRGGQDRNSLLSSLAGQLGGIAALAGLNAGETADRAEALQMLQSQTLAREFLEDNKLLPLFYPEDWDAKTGAWKGKPKTMNQGVRKFDHQIRGVVEDRRTGLITVRITWRDPQQAAAWANELVRRANARLRQRAIDRAQRSLAYLQSEATKSENVEIRQALYRLMEEQYKNLLLANVSAEYSFAVIDPAVPPDPGQYISPNRVLYGIVGLFLGGLISLFMVYVAASRQARLNMELETAR